MAYGQRNYGDGNRRSGNSYSGSGGSYRGGNRSFNKPNFPARCNECGNSCTVPFKPNGSKPVLCNDCFRGNEGGGEPRGFDRSSSFGRFHNRSDDRPQRTLSGPAPVGPSLKSEIQAINRKLDKILSLLDDAIIEVKDQKDEKKQKNFVEKETEG